MSGSYSFYEFSDIDNSLTPAKSQNKKSISTSPYKLNKESPKITLFNAISK